LAGRTWHFSQVQRTRKRYPDLAALRQRHPELTRRLGTAWSGAVPEHLAQRWEEWLDERIRGQAGAEELVRIVEAFSDFFVDMAPLHSAYFAALSGSAGEASAKRLQHGRARALWGVTPIINIVPAAAADRQLGLNAETVVFTSYYITSEFDINLKDHLSWFEHERPELLRAFGWVVLSWAVLRFDVFHYFLDRGILPPAGRFGIHRDELLLLAASKKALFVYAYGADYRTRARTLAAGRWNFCMDCPEPGRFCVCDEAEARAIFERTAAYATSIAATGLSRDYLPGSVNPHYFALDLTRFEYVGVERDPQRPLRVVHSPNHAFFKGTKFLERAVRRLQDEGLDVELVTVSGVSNEEARRLYGSADLIAEQFIGGIHGYTAIEGMALGKPVMCYIRDRSLLIDAATCPIVETNPDQIEERLRHYIAHRDELVDIGRRGREYVERYYSITALAGRLARMYRASPNVSEAFRDWSKGVAGAAALDPALVPSRHARIAHAAQRLISPVMSMIPDSSVQFRLSDLHAVGVQLRRLDLRVVDATARSVVWAAVRCVWRGVRTGGSLGLGLLEESAVWLGRQLSAHRMRRGRPRSVWGVTPLVNFPSTAKSDRLLGIRAETLVFTTYPVCRDFDINLQRVYEWLAARRPALLPAFHRLVLVGAIVRFDFFHLFLDRGILPPDAGRRFGIRSRELELLSRAGKRLFTYTYGADVRVRETTLALGPHQICGTCPQPGAHCICDGAQARENVERVRRYASCMCAMGDMLLYVPGARDTAFWPLDLDRLPFHGTQAEEGRPLRVVHASNHSHFKGTVHLEKAIAELRGEGVDIELVSLTGVDRADALALLASGDVVADQFTAGFHGYTALEGLALGKPVMVFLRSDDTQIEGAACPLINAPPERLREILRELSLRRSELAELGWRGRKYVERYYSIEAFALRLAAMYLDTARLPPATYRRIEEAMPGLRVAVDARVAAFEARHPRPAVDGPSYQPRRAVRKLGAPA
jgi:hypothetical protein